MPGVVCCCLLGCDMVPFCLLYDKRPYLLFLHITCMHVCFVLLKYRLPLCLCLTCSPSLSLRRSVLDAVGPRAAPSRPSRGPAPAQPPAPRRAGVRPPPKKKPPPRPPPPKFQVGIAPLLPFSCDSSALPCLSCSTQHRSIKHTCSWSDRRGAGTSGARDAVVGIIGSGVGGVERAPCTVNTSGSGRLF